MTTTTTKRRPDKRKPRYESNVVKFKDSPLSNRQKFIVSDIAEKAWDAREIGDTRNAKAFRQSESIACIGCRVSEARQSHFAILMAHFAQLAGDYAAAFDWQLKADPKEQERAKKLYFVTKFLTSHGKGIEYGDAICLDVWACPMPRASAVQLDYLYTAKLKPALTGAHATPMHADKEDLATPSRVPADLAEKFTAGVRALPLLETADADPF